MRYGPGDRESTNVEDRRGEPLPPEMAAVQTNRPPSNPTSNTNTRGTPPPIGFGVPTIGVPGLFKTPLAFDTMKGAEYFQDSGRVPSTVNLTLHVPNNYAKEDFTRLTQTFVDTSRALLRQFYFAQHERFASSDQTFMKAARAFPGLLATYTNNNGMENLKLDVYLPDRINEPVIPPIPETPPPVVENFQPTVDTPPPVDEERANIPPQEEETPILAQFFEENQQRTEDIERSQFEEEKPEFQEFEKFVEDNVQAWIDEEYEDFLKQIDPVELLPIRWITEYTCVFVTGNDGQKVIAVYPSWMFYIPKGAQPIGGGRCKNGTWDHVPLRTAQYRFGKMGMVGMSALAFSSTGGCKEGHDKYFLTRAIDLHCNSQETEIETKYAPTFCVDADYSIHTATQKWAVSGTSGGDGGALESIRDIKETTSPYLPYAITFDGTQLYAGGLFAISGERIPDICKLIETNQNEGNFDKILIQPEDTLASIVDLEKDDVLNKDSDAIDRKLEPYPYSEWITYVGLNAEGVALRSKRNFFGAVSVMGKLPEYCADKDAFVDQLTADADAEKGPIPIALQAVYDAELNYKLVARPLSIPDFLAKTATMNDTAPGGSGFPGADNGIPNTTLKGTIHSVDVTDLFKKGPCEITEVIDSDGKTSLDICQSCEDRVQELFGLPPDICSPWLCAPPDFTFCTPVYTWWVMASLWYFAHGYPATAVINPCNLVCTDGMLNPFQGYQWPGADGYEDVTKFYIADDRMVSGLVYIPFFNYIFTLTGNMSNVWPITFENINKIRIKGNLWRTKTGCEILKRIKEKHPGCTLPIGIHPIGAPCFVFIDYDYYDITSEGVAKIPLRCYQYKWAQIRQTKEVMTAGGCMKPRTPKVPPFHVFYLAAEGADTQAEGLDKWVPAEGFYTTFKDGGWDVVWMPALYEAAKCNTDINPIPVAGTLVQPDFNLPLYMPRTTIGTNTGYSFADDFFMTPDNEITFSDEDQYCGLDCVTQRKSDVPALTQDPSTGTNTSPVQDLPTDQTGQDSTCPDYAKQQDPTNYDVCCTIEGHPWVESLRISIPETEYMEVWPDPESMGSSQTTPMFDSSQSKSLESSETTLVTFPMPVKSNVRDHTYQWEVNYKIWKEKTSTVEPGTSANTTSIPPVAQKDAVVSTEVKYSAKMKIKNPWFAVNPEDEEFFEWEMPNPFPNAKGGTTGGATNNAASGIEPATGSTFTGGGGTFSGGGATGSWGDTQAGGTGGGGTDPNKPKEADIDYAGVWGWIDVTDNCNHFQGVIITKDDPTKEAVASAQGEGPRQIKKLYINGVNCTESLPANIAPGITIDNINTIMCGFTRRRLFLFGIVVYDPDLRLETQTPPEATKYYDFGKKDKAFTGV